MKMILFQVSKPKRTMDMNDILQNSYRLSCSIRIEWVNLDKPESVDEGQMEIEGNHTSDCAGSWFD